MWPRLIWQTARNGGASTIRNLLFHRRVRCARAATSYIRRHVIGNAGLEGKVYLLKPQTQRLPNFKKLKPVGSVYTTSLNIPPQRFNLGFPGVTDRFEWFAIDYNGKFWISMPGEYNFGLTSDDGSKLYIDGHLVIDIDGLHSPAIGYGKRELKGGSHRIRISYFQGPRDTVALVLSAARPNQYNLRIFNMNDYMPPAEN